MKCHHRQADGETSYTYDLNGNKLTLEKRDNIKKDKQMNTDEYSDKLNEHEYDYIHYTRGMNRQY